MSERPTEESASPSATRRVRVTAEIVVQVVDEAALCRAANERVDTTYPAEGQREEERTLIQSDHANAVLSLIDPDFLADAIPGVEVIEATWGADLIADTDAEDEDTPDFAALFPAHHADDEDEGWQLTPRTAATLYYALALLADDAYDDVEQHGDTPVTDDGEWHLFDRLPRLSWHQDTQWRRQLARAFDDLSYDLADGRRPVPSCNAEELALHLAIADAPAVLEMTEVVEADLADLPEHSDDHDWEMCSEVFFQDHDILLIYDPVADGIEDPDGDLNQETGIGDLRPHTWFHPFANVQPRDPHRGFRR